MATDFANVSFARDGRLRLLIIVGTRPEVIRLSEVIKKCRRHFDCLLAHTGQNYDYTLNGIFFRDLSLDDPDVYLDAVGDGFEKGTVFLPQLLQAATAAQAAFEAIKAKIAASGQAQGSKGKIVIATVKGDVHDIGKNIVRVILENYGYDVLDLGRDVDPERVVEAVRQTGAKLVGLSALMTTTVPNMQATIEALHAAHLDCKVMVGGAVLTPDYARDIGADYYCKDAKASADLAKQLLG